MDILYQLLSILSVLSFITTLAAIWKVFEKAGYAGWKIFVPFYENEGLTLNR